jgi:threonine dehydratase
MKYIDDIVLVSEDEIRQAFRFVLERTKQLIEPSSVTTVAAVMFNKIPFKNKKIVTVITGGNVDLAQIPVLLQETKYNLI